MAWKFYDSSGRVKIVTTSGASNYQTVQDEGSSLTQRPTLNFTGTGVTASDDSGNNRTNVSIPGGGSGATIFGLIGL